MSVNPPGRDRRQVRRAVVAAAVGTAVEWYDFFLYSIAAALVFPKLFFPSADPHTATLLAFSTYFVGFVARPVGAALFGHLGDRIGRKSSLIATLLLMGASTALIGLCPGHDRIGVWGAVLLTFGRVLQGIGVGGEWAGSALLAAEWAEEKERGFAASWPQWGAPAGLVLANGTFLYMSRLPAADFYDWGWRVPFLLSVGLVGVGFWIRRGIEETPVFTELQRTGQVHRAPVVEVLRRNWREVILTALLRTGQQTPFYIFTAYVLSYATQRLGLHQPDILNLVLGASLISLVTIPLFGWLSDRVGGPRLILVGCLVMLVWPFVYFGLLDSRRAIWVAVAVLLAQPLHDLQYAPQAAVIAGAFPPALRYSGSSLGYQLASLTAGGPAPLVALWLMKRTGSSTAIAIYLSLTGLVSLVALLALQARTRTGQAVRPGF